jgi:hypothetical protein
LVATGVLYFHAIAGTGCLRELFLRLVRGESSQFRPALLDLNFNRAAKASNLAGAALAKNKGHERFFLNAASISDAVAKPGKVTCFRSFPRK